MAEPAPLYAPVTFAAYIDLGRMGLADCVRLFAGAYLTISLATVRPL